MLRKRYAVQLCSRANGVLYDDDPADCGSCLWLCERASHDRTVKAKKTYTTYVPDSPAKLKLTVPRESFLPSSRFRSAFSPGGKLAKLFCIPSSLCCSSLLFSSCVPILLSGACITVVTVSTRRYMDIVHCCCSDRVRREVPSVTS